MGASVIKDLDDDEFEYCLAIYEEFKNLFLNLYDERLSRENKILENNFYQLILVLNELPKFFK